MSVLNRARSSSALVGFALLAGCALDPQTDSTDEASAIAAEFRSDPESACGPTFDARPVEQYDGRFGVSSQFVALHERRVGLQVEVGCSGTLISDDLYLSAGHCGYAVGQHVRFDFQTDANNVARATRDFEISAVLEQENNASWDYAIVRLNGTPGREYGHANIAAIDPPAGSLVTLIQHPAWQAKQIHAAPVTDYSSGEGANWFRHQVDTVGGTSGSGVLNTDGQLVGVHTNSGCTATSPVGGNSAMRMSQLVPHSRTLQALSRSKILWRNSDTRISIWSVNPDGSQKSFAEHGPLVGWTPVSMENNRVMFRHTDGRETLWVIRDDGSQETYAQNGPFAGWTAINYSDGRILWRHTDGRISLWNVNSVGNYVSHKEHGPFVGWTALHYANNRIVWRNNDGRISFWVVDDAGNQTTYREYPNMPGWTPISYSNGELFFKNADGRTSVWTMDRAGNQLTWAENGPHAGWTAIANGDRHLVWGQSDGKISYWTTNSIGAYVGHKEHGPFINWRALFTTGGRP